MQLGVRVLRDFLNTVLISCVICLIAGCMTPPMKYYYSFQFDTRRDGQDARVIDYRYLADSKVLVEAPRDYVDAGKDFEQWDTSDEMYRGTSLYVKWKDLKSGLVYEKTIDLHKTLSGDLEGKVIYLMFYGNEVFVYLISKDYRAPDEPAIGPSMTNYLSTKLIFPAK